MVCSKCGAPLKEGAKFCEKCGQAVAAPAAKQPTESVQKVAQDAVKKLQGLVGAVKEKVAASDKQTLIGLGAFALCVLLLFVGVLNATNGELYKIPVLSIGGELEDTVEDAKDEIKEDLDVIEDRLDDADLSNKEERLAKNFLKKANKLTKTFSISNIKAMLKSAEKVAKEVDDEISLGGFDEDLAEVTEVLGVIQTALWIFMLIPMVLTLVAGFRKNFVVGIIAACFAFLFFLIFGGIFWGLLATASYVLQIRSYYQQKKARQAAEA